MIIAEQQGAVLAIYDDEYRAPANPAAAKREVISSFTRKSRRRMLILLNRLDYNCRLSFVTLTFHASPTISQSNIAFKRFARVMRRRFPQSYAVWRREFQPQRGAVHFHLLFFNLPFIPQDELQELWTRCTGEDRSIVDIRLVKTRKHAMKYVSKYIGKVSDDPAITSLEHSPYWNREGRKSIGRCWGYINAELFRFAPTTRIAINDPDMTAYWWWSIKHRTGGRCGLDPHVAILFGDDVHDDMVFAMTYARVFGELPPDEGKICYDEVRRKTSLQNCVCKEKE